MIGEPSELSAKRLQTAPHEVLVRLWKRLLVVACHLETHGREAAFREADEARRDVEVELRRRLLPH